MSEQGDKRYIVAVYWSTMTSATFHYAGGTITTPTSAPRFIVTVEGGGGTEALGHFPTANEAILYAEAWASVVGFPVEDRIA